MEQTTRVPLLAAVVLLHAGFLYLLQIGSLQRMSKPEEPVREMVVEMIAPEPPQPPQPAKQEPPPPPEPPKPAPPKPKSKPIVPRVVPTPEQKEPAPIQPAPVQPQPPAPAAKAEPSAPPAPPAPSRPRILNGVKIISMPQPDYPTVSRRMGETGTVVVHIFINTNGLPDASKTEILQSSGYPRLDQEALKAALRARFVPFIEGDKAIAGYVKQPFTFKEKGED
jgi:protein TonB